MSSRRSSRSFGSRFSKHGCGHRSYANQPEAVDMLIHSMTTMMRGQLEAQDSERRSQEREAGSEDEKVQGEQLPSYQAAVGKL